MGVELPINVKLLYEGMEELGSEGLFEAIVAESKDGKFLNDVVHHCVCSDGCIDGLLLNCVSHGKTGFFLHFRQLLDRKDKAVSDLWSVRCGLLSGRCTGL